MPWCAQGLYNQSLNFTYFARHELTPYIFKNNYFFCNHVLFAFPLHFRYVVCNSEYRICKASDPNGLAFGLQISNKLNCEKLIVSDQKVSTEKQLCTKHHLCISHKGIVSANSRRSVSICPSVCYNPLLVYEIQLKTFDSIFTCVA